MSQLNITQPTIGDVISNKYLDVMFKLPKKRTFINPCDFLCIFRQLPQTPATSPPRPPPRREITSTEQNPRWGKARTRTPPGEVPKVMGVPHSWLVYFRESHLKLGCELGVALFLETTKYGDLVTYLLLDCCPKETLGLYIIILGSIRGKPCKYAFHLVLRIFHQ